MLTLEEIKKIADLARIGLSEEEIKRLQKDLSAVLDYVEDLKSVNTDGLEEIAQVTGLVNVQRQDTAEVSEIREQIFSQAPDTKDGFFKVKAIL